MRTMFCGINLVDHTSEKRVVTANVQGDERPANAVLGQEALFHISYPTAYDGAWYFSRHVCTACGTLSWESQACCSNLVYV